MSAPFKPAAQAHAQQGLGYTSLLDPHLAQYYAE